MIVDIQIEADEAPEPDSMRAWASWASGEILDLPALSPDTEVCLRVVSADEIQTLNRDWRHKDAPTNVLSFPFEPLPGVDLPLLGDIVIAASVANHEAEQQNKRREHHWAHLIVHSMLHLRGFDHMDDDEATVMEQLERDLLLPHGISDPYEY